MRDVHKAYASARREAGFFSRHYAKLKNLVLVVFTGSLIGWQVYNPNKRVLEAMAGGVLFLLLWRFSTIGALWMLLIMYPFPFAISWGTSNEVFMLIIVTVVLIRMAANVYKISIDRRIRLPLILLAAAYVLSFKNIEPGLEKLAFINTFNFFAAAGLMVLIINFVDDESKLRMTLQVLMISLVLFISFTIFELLFPGRVIIPNWLYTSHTTRLVMKGLRMGGPFHDYELTAEFFTLNAFLLFFLFIRARRLLFRSLFGALLLVDVFMMFTTITRGAIFSLIAGTVYLMFLSRKELNIFRISVIVGALAAILIVMEVVVARYTTSGSLFARVFETTFEKGLVPSNRVGTWFPAIERGMKAPLFGHGAGWEFREGLTTQFWPHCLYLYYFNIIGFFGLGAFVFFIIRIIKSTFPGVRASLTASSFPEALMKIMHVMVIIFLFDQIKIEYMRNNLYAYFIWTFFGLVIATQNIIMKQREERETVSRGQDPVAVEAPITVQGAKRTI